MRGNQQPEKYEEVRGTNQGVRISAELRWPFREGSNFSRVQEEPSIRKRLCQREKAKSSDLKRIGSRGRARTYNITVNSRALYH